MSIPKTVATLGIGRENLRLVRTAGDFRIDLNALEDAIAADRRAGRKPIALVASAGTITTGAVDPLLQTAEIARANELWLHVDGAYGALAALAEPAKLEGLSMADSDPTDAHKWLTSLDCSPLLYRDAEIARALSRTPATTRGRRLTIRSKASRSSESLELLKTIPRPRLGLPAITGLPPSETRSPRISGRLGCSQNSSRESRHSSCSRPSS